MKQYVDETETKKPDCWYEIALNPTLLQTCSHPGKPHVPSFVGFLLGASRVSLLKEKKDEGHERIPEFPEKNENSSTKSVAQSSGCYFIKRPYLRKKNLLLQGFQEIG